MQDRVTETLPTNPQRSHRRRPQPRSQAKRQKILEAATKHFAQHGYQATRVEDIALKLGIAKGSIFQHYGSKEGLFLECYKSAIQSLGTYMDAPPEVLEQGFFAALRYWFDTLEGRLKQDRTAWRIAVIGEYGTSMTLRKEVNQFLEANDPYGVVAFVRMGIDRGEVRNDIDPAILGTTVHWMAERFQDACIAEELDPGLIRRREPAPFGGKGTIDQYLELMRSAFARR